MKRAVPFAVLVALSAHAQDNTCQVSKPMDGQRLLRIAVSRVPPGEFDEDVIDLFYARAEESFVH